MIHLQKIITNNGPHIQLIVFAGLFAACWNIENFVGILFNYKKWRHAWNNAPFIFTNIPGQLVMGVIFAKTMGWTSQYQLVSCINSGLRGTH